MKDIAEGSHQCLSDAATRCEKEGHWCDECRECANDWALTQSCWVSKT